MANASQDFVPVKAVREGVVILRDGKLRAVLMASSLNFALKSEDEQNAIVSQFQNFLNSLDFSIQIFIQSRELDIRPYVALLEKQLGESVDELMQIQIREYIAFIQTFVENANIMTKNFFIVVPYDPPTITAKRNPVVNLFKKQQGKDDITNEENLTFQEHLSQLEQRMAVVEQGLIRTGVRVAKLGSEEVIELLYKMFNPGDQEKPIPLTAMTQTAEAAAKEIK